MNFLRIDNSTFATASRFVVAAAAAACFSTVALAQVPPDYSAQVLGPAVYVQDMNESGVVIGKTALGMMTSFVVGPGHPYELLPIPDGFMGAEAFSINSDGLIVGTATVTEEAVPGRAVLWTPNRMNGYDVKFLGELPGDTRSAAYVINDRRQIVGVSITPGAKTSTTVWFNGPEGIVDISQFGAPMYPQDLNNQGVLVGMYGDLFVLDTMTKITLPPFKESFFRGAAINNNSDVVGVISFDDAMTAPACVSLKGNWELMGLLVDPSKEVMAYDINDSGLVVMDAQVPGDDRVTVAVHYPTGELFSLAEMKVTHELENMKFVAGHGAAINNIGQVAAIVQDPLTGQSSLALLSPVVRTGDLNIDGLVDINDLLLLLNAWGPCGTACPADLNGSGAVDVLDLIMLLSHWS